MDKLHDTSHSHRAKTSPDHNQKLPDLPNELLVPILRCLDCPSLKQARLTCHRWGRAGAHSLFRRIYFAPRTDIMKIFTTMTENPVFALNITEVVYDARIFSVHMLASGVYEKAFQTGFTRENLEMPAEFTHEDRFITNLPASKFATSRQRYAALLQEQVEIFDAKKDLVTLTAGFSHLPNLMSISVQDILESYHFPAPEAIDNHQWYRDWSNHAFKGTMPPSRWDADLRCNSGHLLQQHPWEFRGIDSLWQAAVSAHPPKLRELRMSLHNSALSEELYSRRDSTETFYKLLVRLKKLNLETKESRGVDRGFEPLAEILDKASQLEELSLNNPNNYPVLVKSWPRLRVLHLRHVFAHAAELEAIICSCASTLRELGLRFMYLRDKSWEDCSRDIGRHLQLRFILVRRLMWYPTVGERSQEIEQRQMELTARNFMGNIPESDLGFQSSGPRYPVMVWRKDDYVPNLEYDHIWDGG